jgi:hypothetical protein
VISRIAHYQGFPSTSTVSILGNEGYLFHSGTPNRLWFQGLSASADRMIAL